MSKAPFNIEDARWEEHHRPEAIGEPRTDNPQHVVAQQGAYTYYDSSRKEYLIKNSGGRWIPLNETQIKRHLRKRGLSSRASEGVNLSPLEEELIRLQDKSDVQFAGSLAGHTEGFYEVNGIRFLVTDSPKLITPSEGEWPTLQRLLTGLLDGGEQELVFKAWLKVGLQMLRTEARQPGQALVLAGPANCGKSLLQGIITEIFGGRSAKAGMFLQGRTEFNAELFGAEHLVLEDEFMSHRISDRNKLGAGIKGLAVNELHPCHRKRQTIVNLRPFWRVSISVNDDPEALQVLPPMDDHLKDKFILLRCEKASMPMPTNTAQEQRRFRETLSAELPAFLAHLEQFSIPEHLRCSRYGVASFHHAQLALDLDALSPEQHLLELIDAAGQDLFGFGDEWRGTAAELKAELLKCSATQAEAGKLLEWRNAPGTYLGRLAKKHPERVEPDRKADSREWIVRRMTP